DDGFAEAITSLAEATGYPVLAEATSQARYGGGPLTVSLYDAMLRHEPFARAHRPELVLRFGGGLTPKVPQAWLEGSGADVVLFSDEGALFDPSHRASRVVEGSAVAACAAIGQGLQRGMGTWARGFLWAEQWCRAALESAFSEDATLTEMRLAHDVVSVLPEGANLFVSSSMPIRDLDAFAPSTGKRLRVLANRGANGIDGIVSSALGMSAASGRPTVLLTGDLALLHDMGGLLLARRNRVSLTVVVVNNDGGGIFSFLPIAQAEAARGHYETLWGTPHGVDFSHAAALYQANYRRPESPAALRSAVAEGLKGGLNLIEVQVKDRTRNVEAHRQLFARMAASLGEGPWL
ncbi:MAG: thiamine pyrophosphate-dependent enzyme, partial [Cystobacter sp.]